MLFRLLKAAIISVCGVLVWAGEATAQDKKTVDPPANAMPGLVLPDRRPGEFTGAIGRTYKDSKGDFPETRKAPAGAPNVIIVLLDDLGFGHTSTFGGPVPTPTLDRLARDGLRYTRWHTTALCSPTRASLLTGRNHHEAGFGMVAEMATGFPGYNAVLPDTGVTIAAILRDSGYNTAAFGKWHLTPDFEQSQAGPFRQWPTGVGFEYFYGFLGGDADQYSPPVFENTVPVERPRGVENYHLMTDMTDRAIGWIRNQQAAVPGKPFFIYFAPGATHAPHHAPKAWADRFKGHFDRGWNRVSEETFARMKRFGIIPAGAGYNPIPDEVGVWDGLDPGRKRLFSRMMEVFAGYLAYADDEIGRLLDAVEELGQRDNTLVIYAAGDNGSSAEGGFRGTLNEAATMLNGLPAEGVREMVRRIDEIGGPGTYSNFPAGWAMAGNCPFKFAKRQASHFGGTRNGLVISWPRGIATPGAIRTQFHHCSDIAPTILEAARIPAPEVVDGVRQRPMSGISMLYTFGPDGGSARGRRTTQYFEMMGTRAIYHDGWMAATTHGRVPWGIEQPGIDFDQDTWELYHVDEDFTQHDDVAGEHPDRLRELRALFLEEARKYQVLPLDDRTTERMNRGMADRPTGPAGGLTRLTYYPGMARLPEGSAPDIKNRSFSLSAEVDLPATGSSGVLITQGGRFGGWALLVRENRPAFVYNWMQREVTRLTARETLPAGKHVIRFDFVYDGGGPGRGGGGVLSVDDKPVAGGRLARTVPNRFSLGEALDVGRDTGTPVTEDYQVPSPFTGKLGRVTVELK